MIRLAAIQLIATSVLLGAVLPLVAASITNIDLETDGSVDPPGDVLQVSVFAKPTEESLRLEVRAYQVNPASGEVIDRVRASDESHRDEEGFFVSKTDLSRDALQAKPSVVSVIVPYTALKLPPGEHTIGYVALLKTADRIVSERPTQLSLCRVSRESQKRIVTKLYKVSKTVPITLEMQVLVPADGKLIERKVV